jgi:hypothetical protein
MRDSIFFSLLGIVMVVYILQLGPRHKQVEIDYGEVFLDNCPFIKCNIYWPNNTLICGASLSDLYSFSIYAYNNTQPHSGSIIWHITTDGKGMKIGYMSPRNLFGYNLIVARCIYGKLISSGLISSII